MLISRGFVDYEMATTLYSEIGGRCAEVYVAGGKRRPHNFRAEVEARQRLKRLLFARRGPRVNLTLHAAAGRT